MVKKLKNILRNVISRPIRKVFNALGFDIVRFKNGANLTAYFFPYFINKEIEGVKFKFFIGDTDGKEWYHTGSNDPYWDEMRFIKEMMIKGGDVIFECGSHHGCTTVLLSKWAGKKGKVIAFEPNPANFEIGKINIAVNSIENVELINKAVGSDSREIQIDMSSSNSKVSMNKMIDATNLYTVKSINLDALETPAPDILKIDVEGFEKDVLVGAKRILKSKPMLALEIHTEALAQYNTSVDEIFDLIGRENYDFWIQWEDNQYPVPYKFEKPINKRVHVFGLPK